MQNELFEPEEPSWFEIEGLNPERLYEKFRTFYDHKYREYEQELAAMGKMKQENRDIPGNLSALVKEALEAQWYITARSESNPHQYCLRKSWKGAISFAKAAAIIREYGYVEWFWKKPYMMLNIGEYKYWSMGWPLEVTVLINRTKIAPCTRADLLRLSY
jgi:hypothetical protein